MSVAYALQRKRITKAHNLAHNVADKQKNSAQTGDYATVNDLQLHASNYLTNQQDNNYLMVCQSGHSVEFATLNEMTDPHLMIAQNRPKSSMTNSLFDPDQPQSYLRTSPDEDFETIDLCYQEHNRQTNPNQPRTQNQNTQIVQHGQANDCQCCCIM